MPVSVEVARVGEPDPVPNDDGGCVMVMVDERMVREGLEERTVIDVRPSDQTWLKVLARRRYLTVDGFQRAFEKIVRQHDPYCGAPDRKTIERWMNGLRMPYNRNQVVIEEMFPGWTAALLFAHPDEQPNPPEPKTEGRRARVQACCSRCGFLVPMLVEVSPAIEFTSA